MYDEDSDSITIEDSYKKVRTKYRIQFSNSRVSVEPDFSVASSDKKIVNMIKNRSKQIQKEILKNALKFEPEEVDD